MTPPTLRAFRLRLWLPLVLIAASTLIFLILLGLEQHNHTQALQRFADQTAHEELLRTQRSLEAVLRRGDGSGLDGTLSELGLNPAITHAALVDDAGVVLAATRFAWRGQDAAAVLPGYSAEAAAQMRQARRETLRLDTEQHTLAAMAPVALALRPGEIRTSRQGVLAIDYDLRPIDARAWARVRQQALVFATVVALAALGLIGMAQWGILRPVAALRAGMARIGAGDFSALPQWRGRGEFEELGTALARMAQELQTSTQALGESEARYRQLSDAAFEAIILHENGQILDANAAADRLMGVAPGGLVAAPCCHGSPRMRWKSHASAPSAVSRASGKWIW